MDASCEGLDDGCVPGPVLHDEQLVRGQDPRRRLVLGSVACVRCGVWSFPIRMGGPHIVTTRAACGAAINQGRAFAWSPSRGAARRCLPIAVDRRYFALHNPNHYYHRDSKNTTDTIIQSPTTQPADRHHNCRRRRRRHRHRHGHWHRHARPPAPSPTQQKAHARQAPRHSSAQHSVPTFEDGSHDGLVVRPRRGGRAVAREQRPHALQVPGLAGVVQRRVAVRITVL